MMTMSSSSEDSAPMHALYANRLGLPATVIGAGGIGSTLTPMIVRAGVERLTVWDNDTVEPVNLVMQNFCIKDLGRLKAMVLCERSLEINPQLSVVAKTRRFVADDWLDGIVFSAVDLMQKGRKVIFEAVERQKSRVPLLVDGRFTRSGDFIDVFCIDTQSDKEMGLYRKWLFDDEEMLRTPMADGMTAHVPLILSGLIGEALADWAEGRRRPWKATYDVLSHHAERYYA